MKAWVQILCFSSISICKNFEDSGVLFSRNRILRIVYSDSSRLKQFESLYDPRCMTQVILLKRLCSLKIARSLDVSNFSSLANSPSGT